MDRSPRSRSPSPRAVARRRDRLSVPPTDKWKVHPVSRLDQEVSERLQNFGTTVIPCALFASRMVHFDGTRRFGLVQHADVRKWYTLVQLSKVGGTVDIELMDIDVGARFDASTSKLDITPRYGIDGKCTDIRITCCDLVCRTRDGVKRDMCIYENDMFLYVFDDQGLLKWSYHDGTLYLSQFSLHKRENLILQGLEDETSLDTESMGAGLLFMRGQYKAVSVDRSGNHLPREIILATIRVSDYFDGAPTKFILEKGSDQIIIRSCGYMKQDITEYLMKPDEAQFGSCGNLNSVRELTELYGRIE